jgi:hypothetical protein
MLLLPSVRSTPSIGLDVDVVRLHDSIRRLCDNVIMIAVI